MRHGQYPSPFRLAGRLALPIALAKAMAREGEAPAEPLSRRHTAPVRAYGGRPAPKKPRVGFVGIGVGIAIGIESFRRPGHRNWSLRYR